MIEFIFGTLIQILIIQTDINDYFKIKKWNLRFWKYALITGAICHIYFQFVVNINSIFAMLLFFYMILFGNMIMLRKNKEFIRIKDIVRVKILLNYIYIGFSNILFGFLYLKIFGEKMEVIYEKIVLFYLMAIPSYITIILIRKGVKKYVENKNKSKNVGRNSSSDDSFSNCNRSSDKSNTIHLARCFSRFEQRPRNIAILNLIGYSALLVLSNSTETLKYYITFLMIISILRSIFEPLLSKRGYFIKHCDVWKDCFSSTHLLYFVALYFCTQSNYDVAVLSTIAIIANFETIRRKDDV